ncbi:MAG: DNA-directed RNA polymerase subunit A' [Candidatus Nanoarchaeia archaeon]|nr:DNA-directed RNA polymerase subunit A' [Candidatus Nanoarchaeia archaeon]
MEETFTHKKISSIKFGLMGPKIIKDMSSAKIVTPELYDKEGYPVDGGLMDVRLGVIDPGLKCKTCGLKLKECPGHFGYIELARPVVHIKFIDVVLDVLRMTCSSCSRLLLSDEKIAQVAKSFEKLSEITDEKNQRILVKKLIAEAKTLSKCPHCQAKQEKVKLEKPSTFLENEKRINPIEVRARLERIPDEDLNLIGINSEVARPEWMILTVLPIPPVTMRPSITLETGERSEDDLTHKLGDIVRINQRLFENINAGAPEIIIEDLWDLLQYHVTTFFDNEVSQLPPARHRSGQPLKTLTARIKFKEGRIRHNLAGKRTNFSARTVIGPDPKLEINEVGVPRVFAMKLTVPERITTWNEQYLKAFVQKGPTDYPGATYIVRPDGRRKKITDETKEQLLEEIQPGFIVERHLLDGDVVLFNRQPSLHKMSMMCHRVRVLDGLTLRLNPAVCTPYNADFDGDEMNLHVPQTEEARAEAEILMEVQTQIISPRFGLSVIGGTQDAISGNYLLTQEGYKVSYETAVDILMRLGLVDFSRLPKKKEVTGKEVFSVLLPEDLDFKSPNKLYKTEPENPESMVVIKKGQLKHGFMDSSNLGEGSGLLLRQIYKLYGPEKGVLFLGRVYRLGIEVLFIDGFTAGISDIDLTQEGDDKIKSILDKIDKEVLLLIKKFDDGKLEALPGRTEEETLELKLLQLLNRARNDAGAVALDNTIYSNTIDMIKSGARGSSIHIAQMSALVGQQAVHGSRVNKGYNDRTLSCFKRGDKGSLAHGFIRSSFKDGMKPYETFFMAMTGRDSLMDTALRTPKSGYLYRRLANAMQDLKIDYDFTVRDASGKIVQFNYGEDGVAVAKSEGGHINVKRIISNILEN